MLKTYNALINIGGDLYEWMDVVIAAEHEQAIRKKEHLLNLDATVINDMRVRIATLKAELSASLLREKMLRDKWSKENLELAATNHRQAEEIKELKTPCYCCRESGCQNVCRCYDALKHEEETPEQAAERMLSVEDYKNHHIIR